jgi:hypothetical protein
MTKPIQFLASVTLLMSSHGLAQQKSVASIPFAVASVHFEQNATDKDVEVVFEVAGGAKGIAKLTVVSPDGRTVIDFTAPDASTLGIRSFRFESPEPSDVASLKAAYPEGVYVFSGATVTGDKLSGKSTLSHALPATTSFVHPKEEAEGVGPNDLAITWAPVQNLAAYIITIEQEEMNVSLEARLPGSATQFTLPDGFLLPETEYQLGIGTVTAEGNTSFIETSFTTAGKE